MKIQTKFALAALTLVTAAFAAVGASPSLSQDGIAASPKVRQQIEERSRYQATVTSDAKRDSCCEPANACCGTHDSCCPAAKSVQPSPAAGTK